jgi:ubiquinone biosynthesis monooxygenase Coq7
MCLTAALTFMNTPTDHFLIALDDAIRTVFAHQHASRANPADKEVDASLTAQEKKLSSALMRVNHVGEVCAQALYSSQALATHDPKLAAQFKRASIEESDHLVWTHDRLKELGSHTSYLNPLWYAGAFALGLAVGKAGKDAVSLGFVMETEKQVEAHLSSHLDLLPAADRKSKAIVEQMKTDEGIHARDAMRAGGVELPMPFKFFMKMSAKVMTTLAHHI